MLNKFFYILVIILAAQMVVGQEVNFTASANKTTVGNGERFKVSFKLNTSGSNFSAPGFNGFRVLSGPNQSSSMQWVNGQMSSSSSYSYILLPTQEGEFTIGSASIVADGKTYKTEPLKIKVVKGTAQPQPQQQRQQQSQRGNPPQQPSQDISDQLKDNLFMKLYVDKNKVFQGEQITATYKIYTRVNILNTNIDELPSFNGFWSENIEMPRNIPTETEVLNGIRYNVAVLKKAVLFPQRTGSLEIDPLGLEVIVRVQQNRRARSIFEQFFGSYREIKHKVTSNSVKIEVLPLPENEKPDDFTGAVGNFSYSASLNKNQITANEAINLTVKINGTGNLKLVDQLPITFPPDFEVYDPKITDHISVSGGGVRGTREFEYLLIPRHPGEFNISPLKFNYFDIQRKKYVTLESDTFNIKVAPGEGGPTANFTPSKKEDLQLLGKDIRYIKTGRSKLKEKGKYFFGGPLFYLLYSLPFLLFALFYILQKQFRAYSSDTVRLKSRKATKMAKKRLSSAQKLMKEGKKTEFYEEVFRALYGYMADKLTIPVSELSKENIATQLNSRAVSEPTIEKLMRTFDHCEMARFAPASELSEQEVYDEAVSIITQIEGEIK